VHARAQSASIVVHSAYTRDVFDGAKPDRIEDFQAEFDGVSFERFAHITSVVRRAAAPPHLRSSCIVLRPIASHACGH
jgi:hypothetical protein